MSVVISLIAGATSYSSCRTESTTERRGTVLNLIREVPGSTLGYPDCGKYRDSALKFVHGRFLPNPLKFIIHLSPDHRLCIV
jgi:hypothetical protein